MKKQNDITNESYRETIWRRFKRHRLEQCLCILQQLDLDLKGSKLDAELLLQKALCELAQAGRNA